MEKNVRSLYGQVFEQPKSLDVNAETQPDPDLRIPKVVYKAAHT